MSTNLDNLGTNLHSNAFLIVPTTALDTPIYDSSNPLAFPHYLVYDENKAIIGGNSINEHILINPNRKVIYTADGKYCFFGVMMGFMKDAQVALKTIMGDAGLKIGKELDDDAMDKYWVANELELKEWLEVTPHNIKGE